MCIRDRRFLSGTPSIVGMLALEDMLDLVGEVGVAAIRSPGTSGRGKRVTLLTQVRLPAP